MMKKLLKILLIFFCYFSSANMTFAHNNCTKILQIQGPEDISIVDQYLFISSTRLPPKYQFERGEIILWDLQRSAKKKLTTKYNISPHGIFAKKIKKNIYVWVINHRKNHSLDNIYFFKFIEKTQELKLIQTIESPSFMNLNDLVVDSDFNIYLSHNHLATQPLKQAIESLISPKGHITKYKDQSKTVIKNLNFPNGIELYHGKQNQKYLIITEMLNKKIHVVNLETYKITKTITLDFYPDNLNIKMDKLYIAGYRSLLSVYLNAIFSKNSPSVVSELNMINYNLKSIFEDNGQLISAASVAAEKNKKLFIGNIYSDFLLKCKL